MTKFALYLAGGGARGAYQAGVLKAISEILPNKAIPFSMVSGVSVGSINAAIIAQYADNFAEGVDKLIDLWSSIHCQQIFNASNYELSKSLLRNAAHLVVKQNRAGYLLDTKPLHHFIHKNVDFEQIKQNIDNGLIETLEVLSNCYETVRTTSFYQHSNPQFEDWHYPRHISQRAQITQKHILASSALPLFFPPVKIDGLHYGDGSLGLVSPLRGALRFNVDKILILGTRRLPVVHNHEHIGNGDVGFAQVLGNMLNSMFQDNLDRDIETVNRMNDIARLLSMWKKRQSPWRPIETLYIRPSEDLAEIAEARYKSMPTLLRFLLNLMGARSHSGDLLSFLLFEEQFSTKLIENGYNDGISARKTILSFFD